MIEMKIIIHINVSTFNFSHFLTVIIISIFVNNN